MSTLRDAVRLFLAADSTIISTLPGGVFDAEVIDRDGLDPDKVLDTNARVKAFMILRWQNSTPISAQVLNAENQFLDVYIYQDRGRALITTAKWRVRFLLHQKIWQADDISAAESTHAGAIREFVAEEFYNASAEGVRYQFAMRGR